MSKATSGFSFPLLAAGVLGLTGVALGAMGAHVLKATLMERGMMQAWETAARYHIFHAVALLGLAAWARASAADSNGLIVWIARCWTIGVVFFSASIYWLALGGPRWLGPVTPVGGIALMAGWLLVMFVAFAKRA